MTFYNFFSDQIVQEFLLAWSASLHEMKRENRDTKVYLSSCLLAVAGDVETLLLRSLCRTLSSCLSAAKANDETLLLRSHSRTHYSCLSAAKAMTRPCCWGAILVHTTPACLLLQTTIEALLLRLQQRIVFSLFKNK